MGRSFVDSPELWRTPNLLTGVHPSGKRASTSATVKGPRNNRPSASLHVFSQSSALSASTTADEVFPKRAGLMNLRVWSNSSMVNSAGLHSTSKTPEGGAFPTRLKPFRSKPKISLSAQPTSYASFSRRSNLLPFSTAPTSVCSVLCRASSWPFKSLA